MGLTDTNTSVDYVHNPNVPSLLILFSLVFTNKLFSTHSCGVTVGEAWSSKGISHQHCPPPASGAPCGRDRYRHADGDSWQTCWSRGGERRGGGGGGGWVWIQLEWVQRMQLCIVWGLAIEMCSFNFSMYLDIVQFKHIQETQTISYCRLASSLLQTVALARTDH